MMRVRWLPASPEEARRVLAEEVRRALALRQDPRPWMEGSLNIRDKQRQVIPFQLNSVQRDYHAHATARDLILKSRQVGVTTYVCAAFFADCLLRPNTTSVIVAHDYDSAERIFRIVQVFWERLPERERLRVGSPRFSNRREFFWPRMNSQFYVGTAGSLAFGRGQTINNLHCSEFAFWPKPEESLIALTQAVPAGGRIVIESTPNARAGMQPTLGWPTDQATKPILVDDLAGAIAEGSVIMHSADLVDECMSFVTKDNGA